MADTKVCQGCSKVLRISELLSLNAVKLQLLSSIRIHPVVNVSWVMQYREQVEE